MAEGTCSIPGCGQQGRVVRTWCIAHYTRWKRHGDPLAGGPTPAKHTSQVCAIDGCGKRPKARDLCSAHLHKLVRYGDPLADRMPKPARLLGCCAAGCHPSAADRFWTKVDGSDYRECWAWTAHRNAKGYGTFGAAPYRKDLAHRWAYLHLVGPIPDGLELDHLCGNRACVNPWHLDPVTHDENVRRANAA